MSSFYMSYNDILERFGLFVNGESACRKNDPAFGLVADGSESKRRVPWGAPLKPKRG
jgi:hypothetical protein